jgi:hypothetical protein
MAPDVVVIVEIDGKPADVTVPLEIDGRYFLYNTEDRSSKEISRKQFEEWSSREPDRHANGFVRFTRAKQRLDTSPNAQRSAYLRLPQRPARQRGRASRRRSVRTNRATARGRDPSEPEPPLDLLDAAVLALGWGRV